MKRTFVTLSVLSLLAMAQAACSQPESSTTSSTAPAAVASPPAATPAPVATPAPPSTFEAVSQAKDSLTQGLAELKNKNYKGALDLVDSAHKNLTAAAANAPAALKVGLEKTGASLESVKGLIEKKDPGAEKGLSNALASVTKLTDLAKGLGDAASAATDAMSKTAAGAAGAASGAASAAGGMLKGAAEKAAGTPMKKE